MIYYIHMFVVVKSSTSLIASTVSVLQLSAVAVIGSYNWVFSGMRVNILYITCLIKDSGIPSVCCT